MNSQYLDLSYDERETVRFSALLGSIWHHMISCILIALVGAALGFAYVTYFVKTQYQSTFTVYVSNRPTTQDVAAGGQSVLDSDGQQIPSHLNTSDMSASQSLANVYLFAFSSGSLQERAADNAGLSIYDEAARHGGLATATVEATTPLVTVTVTADTAEDAYNLAQSLAQETPDYMSGVVSSTYMTVASPPQLPDAPSSLSRTMVVALGFVMGLMLGFIIAIARDHHARVSQDDEGGNSPAHGAHAKGKGSSHVQPQPLADEE